MDRLNRAFAFTLESLHLVDRNDPICEMGAHKVIEIGKTSTYDSQEIARLAVKHLGVQPPQ